MLAILGGVVLVVEAIDLVLDRVELVGDALDLRLLIADPVGVRRPDDDTSEQHGDSDGGAETGAPGATLRFLFRSRHDGSRLYNVTKWLRSSPAGVTPTRSSPAAST